MAAACSKVIPGDLLDSAFSFAQTYSAKPPHLDAACDVRAEYLLLRANDSEDDSIDEVSAAECAEIPVVERYGMNSYQYFIVLGSWLHYFHQLEYIRRSVSGEDDGFHL
jgi:hypothetical protein